MKLTKNKKRLIFIIIVILLMLIFCYWQNNSIGITNIEYSNEKISDEFNGYTIVQISDLHNEEFGKKSSYILKKIKEAQPDIIKVTLTKK